MEPFKSSLGLPDGMNSYSPHRNFNPYPVRPMSPITPDGFLSSFGIGHNFNVPMQYQNNELNLKNFYSQFGNKRNKNKKINKKKSAKRTGFGSNLNNVGYQEPYNLHPGAGGQTYDMLTGKLGPGPGPSRNMFGYGQWSPVVDSTNLSSGIITNVYKNLPPHMMAANGVTGNYVSFGKDIRRKQRKKTPKRFRSSTRPRLTTKSSTNLVDELAVVQDDYIIVLDKNGNSKVIEK